MHGDLRAVSVFLSWNAVDDQFLILPPLQDNVLVDEQFNARITDFGLASLISTAQNGPSGDDAEAGNEVPSSNPNGSAGAPRWHAPEYITGHSKHAPGDIYALGCVIMEVS